MVRPDLKRLALLTCVMLNGGCEKEGYDCSGAEAQASEHVLECLKISQDHFNCNLSALRIFCKKMIIR